jgi:hypothetical protein
MDNAPNEGFKQYLISLAAYPNQEVRLALKASDGTRIDFTSGSLLRILRASII